MKIKVTEKVKGEIVISCLGGSLKRGDTLVLDQTKSSHSDILWAIHHGYLEVVDNPVGIQPMGDVVCFVNCTNRTLTGKMFSKPLDPARSIVIKKSDFIFNDLMKMVEAGKLKIQNADKQPYPEKELETKQATDATNPTEIGKVRSSFNKSKKSNKTAQKKVENKTDIYANKEDKNNLSNKTTKGMHVVDLRDHSEYSGSELFGKSSSPTVVNVKEPIFVDMNGEVS